MNAIQPSRPPLQSVKSRRRPPRTVRPQRLHPHREPAAETTAKLVVNVVLSVAAIASLIQLVPFQMSQQAKLQEIQAEVKRTEKRVEPLRSDFSRGFDPQQSQSIMQEESHRVDPHQRQVVLLDKDAPDEESVSEP